VIKPSEQICLRKSIQLRKIANHARYGIDLAAQCHLYGVIMAVTIRVVALPEDFHILRRIIGICMQPMRGAEVVAAAEMRFHRSP
jgi:hypothetical protein